MNRREFAGSLAAVPAGLWQAVGGKPNILFILADDLGYGDLGCYGQRRIKTPNLDRLASEGIRFTSAYSGSTVCAPSRCALMTGKHTGHATVRGNKRPELGLTEGETTVASMLRTAGYRTALFGKWGLGGPGNHSTPNTRGFDEFYGYLDQVHAHNSFPEHLWENGNEVFLTGNWFNQRKIFSNDQFTQKAIDFVGRESPKPFFLYLTYTIPHANNERGAVEANGMDVPDLGPYGGESWPEVEKSFAASITRMDADVGRILDALKARGIDRNTLIVFSSDNGPHREGNHDPDFFSSRGPLRGIKRDLYEGGIRVPTLARFPSRIRAGQVSDAPWAFWDFLPAAAELAGVQPPGGIDGVPVTLTLLEGTPVRHEYFYWEFHENGFARALRQGEWKLVRQRPKFGAQLFNIVEDQGEKNDLAAKDPDRVRRLTEIMRGARIDHPEFPVKQEKA